MYNRTRFSNEPTQHFIVTVEDSAAPFPGLQETFYGAGGEAGQSYREFTDVAGKQRTGKQNRYALSPMHEFRAELRGRCVRTSAHPGGGNFILLSDNSLVLKGLHPHTMGFDTIRYLLPTLDAGSSEMSHLATEARLKFSDQMPQELSLPNFAYEFGEVKNLIPSILSFAKRFSSKDIAGSYLAWEFGGAPFIGDLYKLSGLYSTITKRLDHLKRTWGKETKLSHIADASTVLPVIRPWIDFPVYCPIGPLDRYEVYPRSYSTTVKFFARLTQRLEGLDTWSGLFRAFAAATGLNDPLGVFWEATPFSFIVDWVSGVSDLFGSVKAQPFQGLWDVHDVGWTVLDSADFQIRQRGWHSLAIVSENVGSLRLSRKRRGLGLPEQGLSLLDLSNLGPKQLALLIALLRGIAPR